MKSQIQIISALCLVMNLCHASDQIMVTLKPSTAIPSMQTSNKAQLMEVAKMQMQPLNKSLLQKINNLTGISFTDYNSLSIGGRVLKAPHELSSSEMQQALSKISSLPEVANAEEDQELSEPDNEDMIPINNGVGANYIASTSATSTIDINSVNPYQWWIANSMVNPANTSQVYSGDDFIKNSLIPTYAGQGINIAVVDRGAVPHPNLQLIPLNPANPTVSGYTFLTDCRDEGSCPMDTDPQLARMQPHPGSIDFTRNG